MVVDIVFWAILFIYFVKFYSRYRTLKSSVLFTIKQEKEWWTFRNFFTSTGLGVTVLFFILILILFMAKGYNSVIGWVNFVFLSFVIGNAAYNFVSSRAFIFTERGIVYPGGFIRWQWVSKYEWIEVNTSHEYMLRLCHNRLGKDAPLPFHGLKVDVNTRKDIEEILHERISIR